MAEDPFSGVKVGTASDIEQGATERQISFIYTLLDERGMDSEDMADHTGFIPEGATKQEASETIKWLKSLPLPTPQVQAGRYAFWMSDKLRFFKVDHGKGQWEGYVFVSELFGAPGAFHQQKTSKALREYVLKQVEENGDEAAALFGRELGICARCGSPLTDAISRAAGMGPICREK